jgi:AcrR family transcriptional regulator
MPATPTAPTHPRRADARRNVERILDAAVEELAHDPDASMGAIARRAGVVRATLYAHFPARETLIDAVTDRAIAHAGEAIAAAAPDDGDPSEALARVLRTAWRTLGHYHALVAINVRRDHSQLRALHEPVLGRIRPLLARGQRGGVFNADVPVDWLLTVVLDLVHAASREVTAGRLPAPRAESALVDAVLGAVSPRPCG